MRVKGEKPMKTKTPPAPRAETRQEAELIALYRRLSEPERQAILSYFTSLARSAPQETPQDKSFE